MALKRNRLKSEESTESQPSSETKKKKKNIVSENSAKLRARFSNQQIKNAVGLVFLFISTTLLLAFTSYIFTGYADQSILNTPIGELTGEEEIHNWFGKNGAVISQKLMGDWFGLSAFSLVLITFLMGFKLVFGVMLLPFKKTLQYTLFALIWVPAFLGFFFDEGRLLFLGGGIGQTINHWLGLSIGSAGSFLLILFTLVLFVMVNFNLSLVKVFEFISPKEPEQKPAEEHDDSEELPDILQDEIHDPIEDEISEIEEEHQHELEDEDDEDIPEPVLKEETVSTPTPTPTSTIVEETTKSEPEEEKDGSIALNLDDSEPETKPKASEESEDELEIEIEETPEEETSFEDEDEQKSKKALEEFGEYDPKLDLSHFQYPKLDLLVDHGDGEIKIDRDELEANKNRIVDTLRNYKIGIQHIKATIGPTVTLYEIVPEAGVRISKIKNLEDDIALSLSALGIRIIAPIPGRGTIGIEVPNRNPDVVSMRSLVASEKFQKSSMALPIALGKTISNETFVTDLAKMPHLLMAGATGQGKSVGLNAILVSLLYKLHPSEIKFVLVDPKKVELTLFNKIERHYLAKLPDAEEAIITDTTKVIHTLNSLCIEMDQRYEMLKDAMVRNLKEYNTKFKARKLNPENGHRFLPYIVLVVDEFADLIMTAGKEVETPIARLAQLARAVGIHLIIATQRPSVNVITGIIKANFPARIAFRVTSKIDSRTILDAGGADQLIGRGDMLLSLGNDLVRLQCGFVDTPEVESITDFIGSQQAYPSAFMLPEYVDENSSGGAGDINDMDRDALFEDAARIIVQHQQGSASLLQRRLKLGYNRAGRIVDQLEAAGIIGPFEGSKARQVLIPDEMALEQLLENLRN